MDFVRIAHVTAACGRDVATLPYAARILIENLARHRLLGKSDVVEQNQLSALVRWEQHVDTAIPLHAERVILPDSSGLPALLDLAALRDAVARSGGDPGIVEPRIPVDVVVDHSLQVDRSASHEALVHNMRREFERNGERYRFLKWAQQAFRSVRVYPPGRGIIHQLNLETIASVVSRTDGPGRPIAFPDFVIGGDSHTPMVNGIGVLGWGVGGIEAEAAMLGHAYVIPLPEFVGVRLVGTLPAGAMTTDLVLAITERLRREKVVSAIVEYFGPGASALATPERATIANMAPEYGATAGFFPIDERTIDFLALTRSPEHAAFVEAYARANDLFRSATAPIPAYGRIIEIDLARVTRSVAGPSRPQDRLDLTAVATDFNTRLSAPLTDGGFAVGATTTALNGSSERPQPGHGAIAIAAITSCTNTSNPSVMIAAGLLARNAVAAGLSVPAWVKTSLAPGSRVVSRYLADLDLLPALEHLGFHVIGYGCTTCGGKSGPLLPLMTDAIDRSGLVATAVLSGNRNFEGRIHRQVRANYIMSPPLVVAFALAGRIDIDFERDPIGHRADGSPVMLAELWPRQDDIERLAGQALQSSLFREVYGDTASDRLWNELEAPTGVRFDWDPKSTYLVAPPFFDLAAAASGVADRLDGARVLGAFGDSLTTDHVSPGGEIPADSAAGRYLIDLGLAPAAFNSYVARRCNHHVMARATFANLRIKNLLVPGREGGVTRLLPDDTTVTIHDAAMTYATRNVPAIVLGGKEYGTGSSRDWAAKGPVLLGVRAVVAESYERIHRANLIGMGIVPLRFQPVEGWRQLGLTGSETFTIEGLADGVAHDAPITVTAHDGERTVRFAVTADLSNESERICLQGGGILASVLRSFSRQDHPVSSTKKPEHA